MVMLGPTVSLSVLIRENFGSCRRIGIPAMRELPVVGVGTALMKTSRAVVILVSKDFKCQFFFHDKLEKLYAL